MELLMVSVKQKVDGKSYMVTAPVIDSRNYRAVIEIRERAIRLFVKKIISRADVYETYKMRIEEV